MPRSPPSVPPRPPAEEVPATGEPPPEIVSTPEIQNWLASIQQYLEDICGTVSESKLNTDQKLRICNTSRKVMGGVSQMAVQYQSLKQKYISAQTSIQILNSRKSISTQIDDLKECILSAPKISQPTISFADTVKKNLVQSVSTSKVAIYPANKEQSSEETKKLVQTIIKPDALKLHIRGMRKTKSGGIIISTEGKEDLQKIKQSEQLKTSGLKIEDTLKRRPKIILLGVPANTPEKELFECIFEQNIVDNHPHVDREDFFSSLKLSHKSGKKDTLYCNYIIELSPEFRKLLIQKERIYINWTSCPVNIHRRSAETRSPLVDTVAPPDTLSKSVPKHRTHRNVLHA